MSAKNHAAYRVLNNGRYRLVTSSVGLEAVGKWITEVLLHPETLWDIDIYIIYVWT